MLGRVQAFLPQMAQAETELHERMKTESQGDFDIENVENVEGPVIEMVRTNLSNCRISKVRLGCR